MKGLLASCGLQGLILEGPKGTLKALGPINRPRLPGKVLQQNYIFRILLDPKLRGSLPTPHTPPGDRAIGAIDSCVFFSQARFRQFNGIQGNAKGRLRMPRKGLRRARGRPSCSRIPGHFRFYLAFPWTPWNCLEPKVTFRKALI